MLFGGSLPLARLAEAASGAALMGFEGVPVSQEDAVSGVVGT